MLVFIAVVAQHEYRGRRKFAQPLQQFRARHVARVAGQQNKVGFFQVKLAQELQAVRDDMLLEALLLQVGAQVAGHARVAFHDEDFYTRGGGPGAGYW